jgi:hypothetical protein
MGLPSTPPAALIWSSAVSTAMRRLAPVATRFFDVITDAALGGVIAQTVNLPVTTSAHSITVDPFNGDVFVALAGTAGANGVNPCRAPHGALAR